MKTVTYHGNPDYLETNDDGETLGPDVFRSFDHHTGEAFTLHAGDSTDISDQAADGLLRDFDEMFSIDGDAGPDPNAAPESRKTGDKTTDAAKVTALTEKLTAAQVAVAELEAKVAQLEAAAAEAGQQPPADEPVTLDELLKQTRPALNELAVKAGIENAADEAAFPTKRDLATALLAKAASA